MAMDWRNRAQRLAALAGLCIGGVAAQGQQVGPLADVDEDEDVPPIELPGPRRGERSSEETRVIEHAPPGAELLARDRLLGELFGLRSGLEEAGIAIDATLVFDASAAWAGGVSRRSVSRALLDVGASFDLERILGLAGGTVFVDVQWQNGRNGSAAVGDIQGFSNIDAPNRTQLNELWYEQTLLDGRLRLKVGKLDANGEFAFVDGGGEFLNSSMGFSPTIFTLPTYPDPAFSVNVFAYPTEFLYVGFGVYDGSGALGVETGRRGLRTFFADNADELFLVGEVGFTYDLFDGLAGRIAAGGWGHTANFERFDGGVEDGTAGFYFLVDQRLWRENSADEEDEQGVAAFFQLGWADEDVSEIALHVGGGATWTGLLPGRDEDVLGFGVTWVQLSDEPGAGFGEDDELTIEWFYRLQITPALAIKPDLQFIHNPGGDAGVDDALVATLRVEAAF